MNGELLFLHSIISLHLYRDSNFGEIQNTVLITDKVLNVWCMEYSSKSSYMKYSRWRTVNWPLHMTGK